MDDIIWILLIFSGIIGIGVLLFKGLSFLQEKPPEIDGNKQLRDYVESKKMKPLVNNRTEIPFGVSPKVVISYPAIGHNKWLPPKDSIIDLPYSDRYDRERVIQRVNILTDCGYEVEIVIAENILIWHKPHEEPQSIDLDKIKNIDWN